ncbi:MAG TPA: PAS domain-containing protein, partial [Desulfurella acetivorans]|nr:PAS domain-containing protein [Desulfurella acetivorans]
MHTLQTFQAIINSSVFGVFIYQEEGKIVFANKRFCKLLDFEEEKELLGKKITEFLPPDMVDMEKIENIIHMRTQGKQFSVEFAEHYFKSKSNAIIPVSVFAYTVEYNNKPSG